MYKKKTTKVLKYKKNNGLMRVLNDKKKLSKKSRAMFLFKKSLKEKEISYGEKKIMVFKREKLNGNDKNGEGAYNVKGILLLFFLSFLYK